MMIGVDVVKDLLYDDRWGHKSGRFSRSRQWISSPTMFLNYLLCILLSKMYMYILLNKMYNVCLYCTHPNMPMYCLLQNVFDSKHIESIFVTNLHWNPAVSK